MIRHLYVSIIGKINIQNFEYYKHFFIFMNLILRSSCVSSIIPYSYLMCDFFIFEKRYLLKKCENFIKIFTRV